jgi:hypothetical protein
MVNMRSLLITGVMAALGFIAGLRPMVPQTLQQNSSAKLIANTGERDDPVVTVFGALQEQNSLRLLAALGAAAETFDSEQWRKLLNQVEGLSETERTRLLPRLLAIWTRLDPQTATKWIRPRLDIIPRDQRLSPRFLVSEWRFLEAWAANAPEEAVEYARGLRQYSEFRYGLLNAATWRRWDKDFAKGFESLRNLSGVDEVGQIMSRLIGSWAETDRDAAFAAAISLPQGRRREEAVGAALKTWAINDPAKALELAASHRVADTATLAQLFTEVAKGKPAEAAAWLEIHGDADGGFKSQLLATTWAQHDPAAALKWAVTNGVSIATPLDRSMVEGMFNGTGDSPLWAAHRKDPDGTIAFIDAMPPGEERTRCIELLTPMITDLAKLNAFVNELPPEAAATTAASAAGFLYFRDPAKGLAWVETLAGETRRNAWMQIGSFLGRQPLDPSRLPQSGPDRDALFSGEVSSQANYKPAESLTKAMEIIDPSLRQETLHFIFTEVFRRGDKANVQAAREWLRDANLPADWKRKWNQ